MHIKATNYLAIYFTAFIFDESLKARSQKPDQSKNTDKNR